MYSPGEVKVGRCLMAQWLEEVLSLAWVASADGLMVVSLHSFWWQ
jgi:hypothetical protein